MDIIDRKFKILAVNPVNGKIYTEENAIILCAKDAATPAALDAYRGKCVELGSNVGHIESIGLAVERVRLFQLNMEGGKGRVPDTVGEELANCLDNDPIPKGDCIILDAVGDLVSDFLYYDRKEDEDLPAGAINEAIADGEVTVSDIVEQFRSTLERGLQT